MIWMKLYYVNHYAEYDTENHTEKTEYPENWWDKGYE